jgi:hypothetical protein
MFADTRINGCVLQSPLEKGRLVDRRPKRPESAMSLSDFSVKLKGGNGAWSITALHVSSSTDALTC